MGAGKTTVGQLVADRLDRPFSDSDVWLVRRAGRTAREIETSDGLDHLHRLEAEHLDEALADEPPPVVAAAASVVDDDASRERLAGTGVTVVWLRASAVTLVARFPAGAHRPLHDSSPATLVPDQLARRGPILARLADLIVDVDDLAPEAIVGAIVAYLGSNRQTSTSRTGA